MTLTRTPLPGGLRRIHSSLMDGYQPFSTGLVLMLAHNQDLIGTTYQPRHLANDWYPDGMTRSWYATGGTVLGIWGPFTWQPDMSLAIRVNTDAAGSPIIHAFSTSAPPSPDGYAALETKLTGTIHHDSAQVDTTTRHWEDLEIEPDPGQGNAFWVSLFAEASTGGELLIRSVSIVEHRRISRA